MGLARVDLLHARDVNTCLQKCGAAMPTPPPYVYVRGTEKDREDEEEEDGERRAKLNGQNEQ